MMVIRSSKCRFFLYLYDFVRLLVLFLSIIALSLLYVTLCNGWTEKKSQEKKSRKKSHGKKVTGKKVTGKKVTIIKDQEKIHILVHKCSKTCFSC